jgi:hypothetical protein
MRLRQSLGFPRTVPPEALGHWTMPPALISAVSFLVTMAGAAAAPSRTADLIVPAQAPGPVRFGAEEIRRALKSRGILIREGSSSSYENFRITLKLRQETQLPGAGGRSSQAPESYSVTTPSSTTVVIEGSDGSGLMYGALDVAEQIGWAEGDDLRGKISAVSKSPYLELRGVNMFLTVQDIDLPGGAFWSDEYWTGYLDMMARNRYNLLDIHGPCDGVTLTFPNGFSYFVSLPGFPEVGVGPERAARNLGRFRQVIRMAADRGIKVAYMNYEAPAPIGPWQTRRFGVDERWDPITQPFLDGTKLEEYTRQAVRSFLAQLPELWMFGFRVGESGQPEDFYKKTYLAALQDAPEGLNVYVRTWIADPAKVRELAASTRHRLFIEPKYNGEQLGLPYQAALGGRQYPPSGSFENYTNYPQNYRILWQIRAHGTHRVFYWGSPDFARRTVRSCRFGNGAGFSMEPMEAYGPAADYLHHNPQTVHSFYKWTFEREWLWHLTWGRTAYDPDVPERVWQNEFQRRFGKTAGEAAYRSMVQSSKIVPFIYAYHNIGLDHQDFAPEFENGDHAFGARLRLWQGRHLDPYGGNNDDFLRVKPLDRTAMIDPAGYAVHVLQNKVTGQMTPFEAADYLDSAADASEKAIAEATRLHPNSPAEFDCMRQDVIAVGWLGRYYRDRILSATHLAFYENTRHHPELGLAWDLLVRAMDDWDELSRITEQHYGFLPEVIRMGVNRFRWRDEGRSLGVDLDQLADMEMDFRRLREREAYHTVVGHVPPPCLKPGRPFQVLATFATGMLREHVSLFYRNNTHSGFTRLELKRANPYERTWTGIIPARAMEPGSLEYYFEADAGVDNGYGGTLTERPPYHVQVNDDKSKPVLSHRPIDAARADSVRIEVEVVSKAPLSEARVFYKPTPAYYEWLSIDMQPAGGSRYAASVPLTPEGILYYFEAVDEHGNAAHFPNFLERTPYFEVQGWDPATPAKPH